MTTISDLHSAHVDAGVAYASAFAAFRTAFVELAAIDAALSSLGGTQVPGFGVFPDIVSFRHAIYLPNASGSLQSDVRARANEIVEGVI